MSIPRIGRRHIHVDGVDYVWTIRKKPTYNQAAFHAPMTVAIQLAEGRSVLRVHLSASRPDTWGAPHDTTVTPDMVREMIRVALGDGWLPSGDQGHEIVFPLENR